jgi:cytochrome c-type biogenesis protein CcmH
MMRRLLPALVLLASLTLPALAVDPSERLADPALEARARELSTGLRCLVCQNETIDESNAGLAHDIRILLRERLVAGDSDEQAVKAIVDRYGEFVLLNPRLHTATLLLWFGPLLVLLLSLGGALLWLRHRPRDIAAETPLSDDERRALHTLLEEKQS